MYIRKLRKIRNKIYVSCVRCAIRFNSDLPEKSREKRALNGIGREMCT